MSKYLIKSVVIYNETSKVIQHVEVSQTPPKYELESPYPPLGYSVNIYGPPAGEPIQPNNKSLKMDFASGVATGALNFKEKETLLWSLVDSDNKTQSITFDGESLYSSNGEEYTLRLKEVNGKYTLSTASKGAQSGTFPGLKVRAFSIYNSTNSDLNISITVGSAEVEPTKNIPVKANGFTQPLTVSSQYGGIVHFGVQNSNTTTNNNAIFKPGEFYVSPEENTSCILKLSQENGKYIFSLYDMSKNYIMIENRSYTVASYQLIKVTRENEDKIHDTDAFSAYIYQTENFLQRGVRGAKDFAWLDLNEILRKNASNVSKDNPFDLVVLLTVKANVKAGSDCMASRPVIFDSRQKNDLNTIINFKLTGTAFKTWLKLSPSGKELDTEIYRFLGAPENKTLVPKFIANAKSKQIAEDIQSEVNEASAAIAEGTIASEEFTVEGQVNEVANADDE